MANKGMTPFSLTLAAAVPQRINVEGDFCHILTATAAVNISFDQRKPLPLPQGVGLRVGAYQSVEVMSTPGDSVVLLLGYGYVNDARASFGGDLEASIIPAATNIPLPDVSCTAGAQTLLEAAVATRLELAIGVPSSAANGIRVGNAATAAAVGLLIEPGQIVFFSSKAAVYAYNSGGGAITVTLTSLRSA